MEGAGGDAEGPAPDEYAWDEYLYGGGPNPKDKAIEESLSGLGGNVPGVGTLGSLVGNVPWATGVNNPYHNTNLSSMLTALQTAYPNQDTNTSYSQLQGGLIPSPPGTTTSSGQWVPSVIPSESGGVGSGGNVSSSSGSSGGDSSSASPWGGGNFDWAPELTESTLDTIKKQSDYWNSEGIPHAFFGGRTADQWWLDHYNYSDMKKISDFYNNAWGAYQASGYTTPSETLVFDGVNFTTNFVNPNYSASDSDQYISNAAELDPYYQLGNNVSPWRTYGGYVKLEDDQLLDYYGESYNSTPYRSLGGPPGIAGNWTTWLNDYQEAGLNAMTKGLVTAYNADPSGLSPHRGGDFNYYLQASSVGSPIDSSWMNEGAEAAYGSTFTWEDLIKQDLGEGNWVDAEGNRLLDGSIWDSDKYIYGMLNEGTGKTDYYLTDNQNIHDLSFSSFMAPKLDPLFSNLGSWKGFDPVGTKIHIQPYDNLASITSLPWTTSTSTSTSPSLAAPVVPDIPPIPPPGDNTVAMTPEPAPPTLSTIAPPPAFLDEPPAITAPPPPLPLPPDLGTIAAPPPLPGPYVPQAAGLNLQAQTGNPLENLFNLYIDDSQTFRNLHTNLYGEEEAKTILPTDYIRPFAFMNRGY